MTLSPQKTGAPEPVMRAVNVSMYFPGTVALDRVTFPVFPGEVNVLVGANGAGKSSLMRILAGIETPSRGTVELDGEAIEFKDPRDAISRGVGIVHQELNICPNLSIAENIFIGRERVDSFGRVRHSEQKRLASKVLSRMKCSVSVDALLQDLTIGNQQIVEIAKVLVSDIRVLILDEPTSSLSASEVKILFDIIRELKKEGVGIVYISHRLEELFEIGDRFTVLRDGKWVGSVTSENVTLNWLLERMVGQQFTADARRAGLKRGACLLSVDNLTVADSVGKLVVDHLSLEAHAGEIIGLYGLLGAGRTELLETLIGLRSALEGTIHLKGARVSLKTTVAKRIAAGFALVPEDRQRFGLIPTRSVSDNVALSRLSSYVGYAGLSLRRLREDVLKMIRDLAIKVSDITVPVTALSGGNQQKVIIGKNLLTRPNVLLLDEPTRGIDVKAKQEVFALMANLADEGYAIIFASTELSEMHAAADRVLVMAGGRVTAEFSRAEATDERLVRASQSQKEDARSPI